MVLQFRDKTILILSQQDWGKMFISKHHYAVELAKLGNKVYFMNGPDRSTVLKSGEIRIEPTDYSNVYLVKHKLFFPYIVKYYLLNVYLFLLKFHIGNVIKKIDDNIDIIWSFDVSNTIPLKLFPKKWFKIFMPVDEPLMPQGVTGAETADVMFSVTQEILDKYENYTVPKLFLNHGVLEEFISNEININNSYDKIKVGLSGNFLRPDIDWLCFLDIVSNNSNVIFNLWGAFDTSNSNLANTAIAELATYKKQLEASGNVIIHGPIGPVELSRELNKMDAFLICYDIEKDQSKGTNYHKVLEYIATGKVIISNNITTYANDDILVSMPVERNNEKLSALFSDVIANLNFHNSTERQFHRIAYAKKHTYSNNIKRIERFINDNVVS